MLTVVGCGLKESCPGALLRRDRNNIVLFVPNLVKLIDLIKVNYKAKHLQNTDRPHQKPCMSSSQKVLFSSNVFYFKSNIIGFI